MSKLEKQTEELVIRKAKYRVKNADGKYEVVYLETSADQVEETNQRVFVTPEEKGKITANENAIAAETSARTEAVNAINGKLDVINGTEETPGSINKALKDAKAYTDEKVREVNSSNEALSGKVTALEEEMEKVDGKISTAKTEAVEAAKTHTNAEISKIDAAYKAADVQVLTDAKAYADGKVSEAKTALEGSISTLAGRVTVNEGAISDLRDAISNKNSNTVVVDTEDKIAEANPDPKVGDIAFVILSKRAYIYKGVDAISAKAVPAGWVVFDEITNELDLVDYLKKTDAESTYRKKTDKIAEGDLETGLAGKINNKADKSYVDQELAKKTDEAYVDAKVEEVVAPVRAESAQNKSDIAKEVSDRKGEITRVEGLVTTEAEERETAVSAVDTKVEGVTQRFNKFVPVVAAEQPEGTETGHVWLEVQA